MIVCMLTLTFKLPNPQSVWVRFCTIHTGVVVKYVVDGTAQPLATGQTPQQAGYEQSLAFAQYLAHKSLHVDVWDGESLLQVSRLMRISMDCSEPG